jgi:hypothetical protein
MLANAVHKRRKSIPKVIVPRSKKQDLQDFELNVMRNMGDFLVL